MMTQLGANDWQRVRECFEDALTVPADRREQFVRDVCVDSALAARVLSLLAAQPQVGHFLETPAASLFERATAREDLSGTALGPYQIVEHIGAGGMGDVYRAHDSRLGRDVAIKVLPPEAAHDDASRRRFEREARAVAALNHPQICTLHDIGVTDGGIRYLVMEFLHGQTLADRLAHGALTPGATLDYAIEIASALRAAHQAGIVHRDLKPGNVMITDAGAKLLDFGLATAGVPGEAATAGHVPSSASAPPITTLLGTVSYMAPEQLRGEAADKRSDVFAFGCVLYEMATGRRVFDDRATGLGARRLTRSSLRTVIEKCLAENPDDRWQTADDLVRELHHAVDARARRQRYTVVAAAAAVVLLLAGGWVLFGGGTGTEPVAVSTQLAVLPLEAIGDMGGDEHLGVAVADAIITRLATVQGVRLRPTTAVLNYRNASNAPQDAATALGVDHILTGTFQRSPSNYRLTFQLVQGTEGTVAWGRTYDVVREGLLDLPDRVAEQVAGALHLELGSVAGDRRSRYTARADAYDHYLKGRAALLNYTEPAMREAIASFERAIAIDSGFALARAGLAVACAWWSIRYAYESEALHWGVRADKEARAALASDPTLAEARLALAGAAGTLYGRFKWPAVIEDARRALDMDPTLELAHVVLMRAYFHLGLFEQMSTEAEKVRRLNPLGNVEVARLEVAASLFSGAYVRARDQAAALLARSEAPTIRTYLGLAQFYTGEVDDALRTLAEGKPGTVAYVRSQAALASVEAAAGDRDAARARAREVELGKYMDHHVAYSLGAAWAQLGDAGEAVTWLQRATDTGFPCFPFVQRDPLLDGIRRHPRFIAFQTALRQRFDRDSAAYAAAR